MDTHIDMWWYSTVDGVDIVQRMDTHIGRLMDCVGEVKNIVPFLLSEGMHNYNQKDLVDEQGYHTHHYMHNYNRKDLDVD